MKTLNKDERIMNNWISVKDKMPENQKKVLATYLNSHGKRRTICAVYVRKFTVLAEDFFTDEWADNEQITDFHKAANNYYVKEGWHESIENWDTYGSVVVSEGEIDHWMLIPSFLGYKIKF